MTLQIGQILEQRYRIEVLLGRGGMGAVYGAVDLTTRAALAIKENRMATPESQRQFRREARLLSELAHASLPRVTDFFSLPDRSQVLVMDFVPGEDLNQILVGRGALPEDQALRWIAQVLDALQYLHDHQVIHRDVKPANIKITPGDRVFLVDFGLAKVFDPGKETTLGARGVTPGYAPPEQYGPGRTDARTDIYSCGATLYAMLAGQRPPDAVERMLGQARLVPLHELNPKVTAAVASSVLQAMAPRPKDRPQAVSEFREALGIAEQKAVDAQPAGVEPVTVVAAEAQPVPSIPAAPETQFGDWVPPVPARFPALEPEMIRVPAVLFLMGTTDGQVATMVERFDWAADFGAGLGGTPFQWEQPYHGVALPAFQIARHPVTNGQYAAYVEATDQAAPTHWGGRECPPSLVDHPVVHVSWHEARAYAAWLQEQTGKPYRLPTEAEWERAARGDDLRLWPWGDEWDQRCANWDPAGQGSTTPVGQYSPQGDSPFGCADMAGNVCEWCSSLHRKYPYRAKDGRERLRGRKYRVIRGGSWSVPHPGYLRCCARIAADPREGAASVGFRLACGEK